MFSLSSKGSFKNTEDFLKRIKNQAIFEGLTKYGDRGVSALAQATPKDSGYTADSWYYEIKRERDSWSIIWGNTNVVDGIPIAILLQVGHATGNGGYVEGKDYMNPALKPIFDQIAAEAWKEVTK